MAIDFAVSSVFRFYREGFLAFNMRNDAPLSTVMAGIKIIHFDYAELQQYVS
jgi:hypothetical protein